MATQVLNDALGTSPSLVRGLGEKSGIKQRADFARANLPETFEGMGKAEEEAARTQFGIQQGQIKKEAEAEAAKRRMLKAFLLHRSRVDDVIEDDDPESYAYVSATFSIACFSQSFLLAMFLCSFLSFI